MSYLRATLPVSLTAALYTEGTSALQHFEPRRQVRCSPKPPRLSLSTLPRMPPFPTPGRNRYEERSQDEALLARTWQRISLPSNRLSTRAWLLRPGMTGRLRWVRMQGCFSWIRRTWLRSQLAKAQIHASNGQLALATLRTLGQECGCPDKSTGRLGGGLCRFRNLDFRGSLRPAFARRSRPGASSDLMVADALMSQANADDNWTIG